MTKTPKEINQKEYEKLGRAIDQAIGLGSYSRVDLIKANVLRGISFGFGTVIGGTIVIALLLGLLSALDTIPFIGPLTEKIKTSLESAQ